MTVVQRPGTPPPGSRLRRRGPRSRLRIALFGVLAVVAIVYGVFTKRIPFVEGHRVKAAFISANELTPGFSPVRVAGVTVGKVVEIEDGPGATAIVVMELDDGALPVRADARARIRPRLFLEGGFQVELSPGSPSAPELEDGDTIPLAQTALPVQFHQILTSFDRSTRRSLRGLIGELDATFRDGGARGLNRTWRPLAPLLRDTARLAEAARGVRPRDLSDGIRHSSKVTAALASRDEQLQALVTNLARTTTVLASRDTEVAASIREFDGLLTELPEFLDAIDRGVPATRRFIADLRPALRAAPPVLDHTADVLDQVAGLVSDRELPALVRGLRPTLTTLVPLERRLGRLFPLVTPVTDCVRERVLPVLEQEAPDGHLSTGRPIWQDLAHAFVGLASAGQSFDGNGFVVRYLAGFGDFTVGTGEAPGVGTLTGLAAGPIQGARPQWLGPGVEPPLRPDQPCVDQAPVDLRQRGGAVDPRPARRVATARPRPTERRLRRALDRAVAELRGDGGR